MPEKDNYQLRSKDVQEVLSTPPRVRILWGNSLIILAIGIFLTFLAFYRISYDQEYPFKVLSYETLTDGGIKLNGIAYISEKKHLHYTGQVKIAMVNNSSNPQATLQGNILHFDSGSGRLSLKLSPFMRRFYTDDYFRRRVELEDRFDKIKIQTDSISLLMLFRKNINF